MRASLFFKSAKRLCCFTLALMLALGFFDLQTNGQGTFSNAGFQVGEQVELVRDEVLFFKQTPFRQAQKGEQFQVAAHDSGRQRVFLMSKNDQGNLIAVNVPELAVRRLAQDWIGLNYTAFESLRDGRLEDAKKSLFYLASVDPDRAVCGEIAACLDRLQKAKTNQKMLRKSLELMDAEVARKLKNAASAEMPSALTKVGDTVRAERYRQEAERMVEAGKRATEEVNAAMKKEIDVIEGIISRLEILKSYTESSNLRAFIQTFAAGELRERFHSGGRQTASLSADVEASRRQVLLAQRALAERRLSDASVAVAEGMKLEPGSYALRRLQTDIQGKMASVLKAYGKALELKESKQYETALRELESSQMTCSDYEPTQKLLAELRQTIAEKDSLIAKAKVNESLQEYELALKVYETYALTQERDRVLGLLATKREEEGNYVAAYDIFESLSRTEDMKRILNLRDSQETEYAKARLLVIDGKFEDAASIYRRFQDHSMEKDTWIRQGAWFEGQAKFDEAITIYRNNGLSEEVQRLKHFITERQSLIQQGVNQEKAGNYDRAISLFKNANVPDDLKRVARIAGKSYFEKKDYASAVEYFEIAGEFEEAGRIRKEFSVEESVRRLTDQELFKRCAPACVTVSNGEGTGSGFFIKRGGYILTNNHCVEGSLKARVITADGKVLDAKVIETSKVPDLALLKVELKENPFLRLGDSDSVSTGIIASTIGSPKGQPQSFTKGNVSNVDREFRKNKCFQISVLINHGNSGGPLFDENGIVIGVCTFGKGTAMVVDGVGIGSDIQGMNYAIKINEAKKVFGSTLAF